jgi:hypothetical protein
MSFLKVFDFAQSRNRESPYDNLLEKVSNYTTEEILCAD